MDQETWDARADQWLPTDKDKSHVAELMQGVHEVGKMAGWIAPPGAGVHGKPVDFEYVRL